MFILILLYYIVIVILTTYETLQVREPWLPSHSIALYEALITFIIIIPLGSESLFTLAIYQFTNSSFIIVFCNMLLKTVYYYNKYIKCKKYQIYMKYMGIIIIKRLIVIYILKNDFTLAFIFSTVTVALGLATHIYVYDKYIKTKMGVCAYNRPEQHIMPIYQYSQTDTGHYMSLYKRYNNIMREIHYDMHKLKYVHNSQIPKDLRELFDRYENIKLNYDHYPPNRIGYPPNYVA